MPLSGRIALAAETLAGARLEGYPALLDALLAAGFAFLTHRAHAEGAGEGAPRAVFLRHDVDEATGAARAMFEAERARGIAGSWYFRRETLDPALMREIEGAGGEASFHYETVAEFARDHGIRTAAELARSGYVRWCLARLARDLAALRALTGLPCRTAASHGHAVNRALGVPNNVLLEERARLPPLGLAMEAYDRDFIASLDAVACDAPAWLNGGWLYGETPRTAIERGARRLLFQVHPHHFAAAWRHRPRRALAALARGRRTAEAAFRRI